MSILNEAAFVGAPRASRVMQLDISTTAGLFVIPDDFAGQFCRWTVYADSGSISAYIAFGTSSVSVTANQDSSVDGSGNVTVSAATGERVDSGQTVSWVMPMKFGPNACTHFSVDATGDGKLVIAVSEG